MPWETANRISDVCLIVSNFESCLDFYQNKLGLSLKRRDIGFAEFQTHTITLALWEATNISESLAITPKTLSGSSVMVAVHVENSLMVDEIYQELSTQGVTFVAEPKKYPWNAYAIYFQDPDENLWEIYTWVESPRIL